MKSQLHPGAHWVFRIQAYVVFIFLSLFFSWFLTIPFFILLMVIFKGVGNIGAITLSVVVFTVVYLIIVIVVGEIYSRMAYNRWFYEFTDRSLKKEKGIIWKKYSDIPYDRIQNVDIHRGIIARMLGFSSISIQTAGYSASGLSEGYIPAVSIEEAERIREFVLKKIGRRNQQGL